MALGAVQTSYGKTLTAAFAGQDFGFNNRKRIMAAVNAEASVSMPFGIFVKRSSVSTDNLAKPAALMLTTNADDVLGVVKHSHTYNPYTDFLTTTPYGILPGVAIDIMEEGEIWVLCEQAVTPADPVYVRYQNSGSSGQIGATRKDTGSGDAVRFKGAYYKAEAQVGLTLGGVAPVTTYVVPIYFNSLMFFPQI